MRFFRDSNYPRFGLSSPAFHGCYLLFMYIALFSFPFSSAFLLISSSLPFTLTLHVLLLPLLLFEVPNLWTSCYYFDLWGFILTCYVIISSYSLFVKKKSILINLFYGLNESFVWVCMILSFMMEFLALFHKLYFFVFYFKTLLHDMFAILWNVSFHLALA